MAWLTDYLRHKRSRIYFVCRNHKAVQSSFMTYYRVCNKTNMPGATCGVETAYPSGAHKFTLGFSGVRVVRSLIFYVVFFSFLVFFFWPLHCLSFFDLELMITPLVSSNCSGLSCFSPSRTYSQRSLN